MMEETIYALDIGTRKVMGLVVRCLPGRPARVLDAEVIEHSTRAMAAGQVQDVAQVAWVVRQVTSVLSQRTGLPLRRAALSARPPQSQRALRLLLLSCPYPTY